MPEAPQIPAVNFQITPDLRLGEGGEAEKFRDNIAAIKALKAIEAGNRRATADEQRLLARYVGWGGIPNAFPNPVTKEFKDEWKARGEELRDLLTPQEHRRASNSTTDAHYTSETVTTAIWDGVQRLGYRGGLAVEMSLGSGNFIGLMPQAVAGRTRFIGVELDSITARIARALYPQSTVLESGMQYVPLADGGFDLDIGNPPFGDTSLTWQHKPGLRGMSIHNQFFVAGLDALKPGGIQAKVVSRYLLDAQDPAARIALAKKGKLLGAIRLPETAFKTNARTQVVTDIIFIQRLTKDEEFHMGQVFAAATGKPEKKPEDERARKALADQVPDWVKTVEIRDPLGGDPMRVNHYFRANGSMVIGTMDRSGSMAHGNDITVKLDKGADFAAELARRIERLPQGVALRDDAAIDASIERHKSMADALEIYVSGQEPGQMVAGADGKLMQVFERETPEGGYELGKREITAASPWSPQLLMDGAGQWYREIVKIGADGKPEKQLKKDGTPGNLNVVTREVFGDESKVPETLRLGKARFERLRDITELRDLLKKQLVLEAQDDAAGKMEANRKALAAAYNAYVAKHGFVSENLTSSLVNDMPDGALVQALELSYKPAISAAKAAKTGDRAREASVKRAPIMSRRVVVPYAPPGQADSPADAVQISLSERGMIDVDRIAALRGKSVDEVTIELTDGDAPLAFFDPELARLETRNSYLTGEVARKLRAAKDAGLARNVDALQKVQPAPITSDNVTAIMGSTWIPSETYADFVKHITGEDSVVTYEPLTNTRSVRGKNTTKSQDWAARNEAGRITVEAITLLQDGMNSQTTKVYYPDADGNMHLHKGDTELAAVKRGELEREFVEWVFADGDRRRMLVAKFNEKFNTRVTRQHDGSHLMLPGKVPDEVISMRRHQKNAIWRGISERFMLLDHVVGAGKTYTAIARVMERRRMGLSRKPMIVVPNHMVEQFAADVYRLYPGAKVLAAGKKDFEKRARRRLFAKIATGDWDVVVVPHSSFAFIGLSPETEDAFLQEELRQALKALKDAEADAEPGTRFKPLGVKKAEQLVKKIEARIDAIRGSKKDRLLSFEQMGVDDVTVDEAHEFKNLFYSTRMSDVRGMGNASGSQKAFDLYTKVRYLRSTPTGSVVFMTGTPISNSAVEMYTMMRYLAADELRDLGLEHFDAWRTQFVDASTAYEQQLTGGVKEVGRLGRTWGNARSLMDLYYSFTDAVTIEDIKTAFAEDNPGKTFPVPKVKGGDRQQIVVKPSPALLDALKEIFEDYEALPNIEDPNERNAERLRLMDRARKSSLDLRAMDPTTPSKEEGGKLDRVADEVARVYKAWTPDMGTQLVFLDRSVPKSKTDAADLKAYDKAAAARDKALAENDEEAYREAIEELDKFDVNAIAEMRAAQSGGWNAYQQIKDNLIARGVPANEIRFIQEANNDEQKQAMFDAVNAGEIRVLIGSTQRMGAGTNVQERLVALHHVDVGWKPSDIEQREGRIVRQGNGFMDPERAMFRPDFEVEILAYATERTADASMWALNGTKLKTINGIRKYDGSFTMEFEDEDSLSMAQMAALASGDPLLLERIQLVGEVDKLERQETSHRRKGLGLKDNIEEYEREIKTLPARIKANEERAELLMGWEDSVRQAAAARSIEVEGKTYASRFQAAAAAMAAIKDQQAGDDAAKFAVTMAGKRITSKTGMETVLEEAFGDTEPVDVLIDGKTVTSRAGIVRAIIERARELALNLDKGRSEGFDIGTTKGLKLVGDVSRSSYGKGAYSIDFALLDDKGQTLATGRGNSESATHDYSAQLARASLDKLLNGSLADSFKTTAGYYRTSLESKQRELPELKRQQATAGPFKYAADLEQKRERLAEVTRLLSVGGRDIEHIDNFGDLFKARPQKQGQDDFGGQIVMDPTATQFSRRGGSGVPMPDAQALAAAIREAFPAAPQIFVHQSLSEAPASLRAEIKRQGATDDVEAAFHEGEIHVFPANIASVDRMAFVVGHHELRHYGLRATLGPRLGPVMLKLWADNPAIRAAAQKVMADGHATTRVLAIEEALADMPVEQLTALTGWDKIVAAVRQWLRQVAARLRKMEFPALADLFEPERWTDNDVAALVSRAEAVSRGGNARFAAAGTAFQREAQTATAAFKRWFGASVVTKDGKAGGEPLVVYHGTIANFDKFKSSASGAVHNGAQGFYFSSSPESASLFASIAADNAGEGNAPASGANVMPVYLRLANPLVVDYEGQEFSDDDFEGYVAQAKKDGRDGVIVRNVVDAGESDQYIAFRPEQIKSAVGNSGAFDPANPDIRFSRAPRVTQQDQDGAPVFASDDITIAFPMDTERFEVIPQAGERVINYAIMPAQGFDVLGHVELLIRDGKPVSLLDIEVTPAGRRAGTGRKVIETLLAANPDSDLNISNIVQEARGFWARMGVPEQNLEQGAAYDGNLNWTAYAEAQDPAAAFDAAPQGREARRGGNAGAEGRGRGAPGQAQGAQEGLTRFSRAAPAPGPGQAQQRPMREQVRNTLSDMLGSAGAKVSWWDRTLGTQYAKAQKFPAFKRVFDQVQQYLEDTSSMANEAAGKASDILPKLDTWKDLTKFGVKEADSKAIAGPIFQGTLTDKKVYSDAELRSQFNLTDAQIGYYRQFLDAVNTSLDQALAADVLRSLGDKNPALREIAITGRDALRDGVTEYLESQIEQGVDADKNTALLKDIGERYARIDKLKSEGYAPLMRFGKYKVHIADAEGATLFFGLYESKSDANKAARELAADPEFQGAVFEQGVLSQEQYKMFAAMPLDSMEMFAEAIGAEKSEVFQEYIRLAKSNRSAMKRLIQRKGTAGFAEDVPRVLAAFVTSNARMAAGALNMPTAKEAALNIRAGDVQDEAIKLIDVAQNPKETAGPIRGLMFVNFIGGSIASAVVNLTQPLTMTLPYLSQWGGGAKAAARLMAAGRMAASGRVMDPSLREALKRAEDGGIVSPQEIHFLTAQAMGTMGNHPLLRKAAFIWSAPFSLAEQFNRRVSFIAAYNTAKESGIEDAFAFAEQAVTETQGLYNAANAPNWARNPIGATALTFKQFSIHYLEWMVRMYRRGPEGKKAVALALALLILAAGTDGLPGADDLDDLVDTLGQALGFDMNSKRARRNFVANTLGFGDEFADVMARGFSAVPGVPLDVSLRMSMGNLIPASGVLLRSNTDRSRDVLEVAGPAGGLAKQALDAGQKLLAGDLVGAGTAAMPVALQNVAKAVGMWTTGEARDTRDRKVMDVDAVDGLMKFLGFNPQAIARESEKMGMIRRSEQLAKNIEGDIAGKWARGVVDKDPEAVADARRQLAEWNADNPGQPIRISLPQILQRVKKLRQDRESRFISTVSRERRAAVAEAMQ